MGRVSVTGEREGPDQTVGGALPVLHIDLGLHGAHSQAGGERHRERGGTGERGGHGPARASWTPRMKFTTGRPKPRFAKPVARDREASRRAREVDRVGADRAHAGDTGTGRVSVTVSARVPSRL